MEQQTNDQTIQDISPDVIPALKMVDVERKLEPVDSNLSPISQAIKSPGYKQGVRGWKADSNGDTEGFGIADALFWRVGSTFGSGSTGYVSNSLASATEAEVQIPIPVAGTISTMYVFIATAQPASGTLVLTFRKNGVDTTLKSTFIANAAAFTFASDLVHSFTVVSGDLLSVKVVNNASSTSASISQVIFRIS